MLLALLLFNDLQAKNRDEEAHNSNELTRSALKDILSSLTPPEADVIGPAELSSSTKEFLGKAQEEAIWFNVCFSMFRPQHTFDLLLRPLLENPSVHSIRFISRPSEKELWKTQLLPKIAACSTKCNISEPDWCDVQDPVSFILIKTSPDGKEEALLSFWGEPFMSMVPGRQVPRYVFLVHKHSSLIGRFREIVRSHALQC
jgi:hypothetical protein